MGPRACDQNFLDQNTEATSLMRIYEIMDFKRQLQHTTEKKLNKEALHAHYKGVKLAESSEEVSLAFIEAANMLYTNVLSSARIQKLLFQLDQAVVNPLDSVFKLREVAVQCEKREPLMFWTFSLLADWWLNTDGIDSIPIRSLREGAESVSLVRLMLFKKQLKEKLLRIMEADFPLWDGSVKTEIRKVVDSVNSCREYLGFFDKDTEKQKTFAPRASWPESADRFLIVFEAVVYGYGHDELITGMLRNRRGVDDCLENKNLKCLF